jgi:hypothetical protein
LFQDEKVKTGDDFGTLHNNPFEGLGFDLPESFSGNEFNQDDFLI